MGVHIDYGNYADHEGDDKKVDLKEYRAYDGFNGKKVYKYQQYNELIRRHKLGKKKFNPEEVILGRTTRKKKVAPRWGNIMPKITSTVKYEVQYSSDDEVTAKGGDDIPSQCCDS